MLKVNKYQKWQLSTTDSIINVHKLRKIIVFSIINPTLDVIDSPLNVIVY